MRENLIRMPSFAAKNVKLEYAADRPMRVGFFGQISKLKGINVLLAAAELLNGQGDYGFVFEIYGDDSGQPPEFQTDFRETLKRAGLNVIYRGPYDRCSVGDLMSGLDAVVVPSIWWENSPIVIQEARLCGLPVLASHIGGMAEKVGADGAAGECFPVGNHISLVQSLRRFRDHLGIRAKQKPVRGICAREHETEA